MKNYGFYILLFSCFLNQASAQTQSVFSLHNRISSGFENDNNVNESPDNATSAQSIYGMLHSQCAINLSPIKINLTYSGALQLYTDETANKTVHEPQAFFSWQLLTKCVIGGQLYSRMKNFTGTEKKYALLHTGPFVQFYFSPSVYLQYQYQRENLNYATLSYFNYQADRHTISAHAWLSTSLKLETQVWQKSTYFSHKVLDFESTGTSQQIDHNLGTSLSMDWTHAIFLLHLTYAFEQANSNQYGFDFNRHTISAIAGLLLDQFYLSTMLTWQYKNYDHTELLNPVYWDSETNENNQLVFELSRDLQPCCTVAFRAGWYRNESIFANLYYDKFLASARLIFRLN